jgi:hypothetical protein
MEGVPQAPKRSFGFWGAFAVASAVLAGGSCGAVTGAESADAFDGAYPLGLSWDHDSAAGGAIALVILAQGFFAVVGTVRAGTPATFFAALAASVVTFVVALVMTPFALPAWRRLGCRLGGGEACLAASSHADEPERSRLEETSCDRGVTRACMVVAARRPEKREALCARQKVRCESSYCGGLDQLCQEK